MTSSTPTPFRVVIAGGGVAALEGALALRDLAGERISTTLLAPEPEFVYRPMRVREPFAYSEARRYPLDEIARDIGVELRQDGSNGSSETVASSTPRAATSSSTTRCCSRSARSAAPGSSTR